MNDAEDDDEDGSKMRRYTRTKNKSRPRNVVAL